VYARSPVTVPFEDLGVEPDSEEIHRIALATGGNTRLYRDKEVPVELADYFRLRVVEFGGRLIMQDGGFLSWREDGTEARINMIAVDPKCQGKGIGSNLLRVWMTMMVGKSRIVAGTQSDNPAAKLYQNHGFKIAEKELTFHKS